MENILRELSALANESGTARIHFKDAESGWKYIRSHRHLRNRIFMGRKNFSQELLIEWLKNFPGDRSSLYRLITTTESALRYCEIFPDNKKDVIHLIHISDLATYNAL